MSNIEVLAGVSRFFQLLGLQNSSTNEVFERKRLSVVRVVHFVVLLIAVSSLMSYTIAFSFYARENSHRAATPRTIFHSFLLKILEYGYFSTVFVGLVESFIKSMKLRKVYRKSIEISHLMSIRLNHLKDYERFRQSSQRKIKFIAGVFVAIHSAISIVSFATNGSVVPGLIGLLPMFVVWS